MQPPKRFATLLTLRRPVLAISSGLKNGFRPSAVLELEQVVVSSDFQGNGIGKMLITDTLPCGIETHSSNDAS